MTGILRSRAAQWAAGAAVLLTGSYLIARQAGTRPSFDAYGWLVWGYQTLHGTLDLAGAPTWKPLPWLFTTPYALLGQTTAMWLWMTTAAALSLAGVVFAGRAAYRLAVLAGLRARAAVAGGAAAGVALLGVQDYAHYVLSFQSDPVIVTLCLAALDCGLRGRPRLFLSLLTLASLGRPEAWALLGAAALWVGLRVPRLRWYAGVCVLVVPALWFGVPAITNGSALLGANTALNSPRALHGNQIGGTIGRFTGIEVLPVAILAVVAIAWAAIRRERHLLSLAAAAAGWVVVEIAFAYHGWAALPRYMFEAAAAEAVLAGVAVAVLAAGGLLGFRVTRIAGPLLAAAAAATFIPYAVAHTNTERRDLGAERYRTDHLKQLALVVRDLGGPVAVRHCGRPVTSVRFGSALAYLTGLDVGQVGHHPDRELRRRHPSVFFLSLSDGWSVLPWHLRPAERPLCDGLKSAFVFPHGDPDGDRHPYLRASFR